ncbi:YrrS family protein [Salibacterium salarium]|nr:YrrS family protein [Salibacterium salarium]
MMKDNNNHGFGEDNRYEMRKRKRMNRILNGSILVVGALILFFALQLFLPASEEVAEEDSNDQSTETEEEVNSPDNTEPTSPDDNQDTDNQSETVETDESDSPDNNTNEQDQQTQTEENEDSEITVPEPDGENGEWEPIGTEQSGSFSHDFNKGSQNWEEMKMALRYAAGIDEEDEMTIWQLENGGEKKAVGTVSTPSNADQPYQITIEFIEGEGWKPIDVEVLESNPY